MHDFYELVLGFYQIEARLGFQSLAGRDWVARIATKEDLALILRKLWVRGSEQLCEDASYSPNIDTMVILLKENYLRCPVPTGLNLL